MSELIAQNAELVCFFIYQGMTGAALIVGLIGVVLSAYKALITMIGR